VRVRLFRSRHPDDLGTGGWRLRRGPLATPEIACAPASRRIYDVAWTAIRARSIQRILSLGPRHGSRASPVSVGPAGRLKSLDALGPLPSLPSAHPMSGAEVAQPTQPLVFIVTPDTGAAPDREYLESAALGSGMLLMADETGYLIGTNRHVVNRPGFFNFTVRTDQTLVISKESAFGQAAVVGRHRTLDLALLWLARSGGRARLRQPVTAYRERLFCTLSNGLISRLDGADVLQLSAPISPGNSGGPVDEAAAICWESSPPRWTGRAAPTPRTSTSRFGPTPFSRRTAGSSAIRAAGICETSSKIRLLNELMATINVTVYDSTENKRVPVELPDDAPANKIIAVLVDKLRLPKNGPDGAPGREACPTTPSGGPSRSSGRCWCGWAGCTCP
jgi:hypothetical protein